MHLGILSLCQQRIELGDLTLQNLISLFISYLFTQLIDKRPEKLMISTIVIGLLRRQAERLNTLGLFQILDIECQITISLGQHIDQRMNHVTPRFLPFSRILGVVTD